MNLYHATCIAIDGNGVLIRGVSGAGKSAMAVQLIDQGAQLVADDQCQLWVQGGGLWASAPDTLKGLLEVRGLGLVRMAYLDKSPVRLVADLKHAEDISRLPDTKSCEVEGIRCAMVEVDPDLPQTPAVVRLALSAAIGKGIDVIP